MSKKATANFLQGELDRAIREIREALGRLAEERKAASWILRLCTLLDRVEFHVIEQEGDSAFLLDEEGERVSFRAAILSRIWTEMERYVSEVDSGAPLVREQQLAVNQFVLHELLHIRQNFPHFATVDAIKRGLPGYGLPLLDIAADTASAWISAHIESQRTDADILPMYVNALLRAYVLGAFVFDARSKPAKRQRVLGLLISVALVQAQVLGRLNRDVIFDGWAPETPVFCLDLEQGITFNAIVLDGALGLLVASFPAFEADDLMEVWNSVGRLKVGVTLGMVVKFLIALGAINTR